MKLNDIGDATVCAYCFNPINDRLAHDCYDGRAYFNLMHRPVNESPSQFVARIAPRKRVVDDVPPVAEGVKNDDGKPKMSLLFVPWKKLVGDVLTFGAKKYNPWNWAKGIVFSRVLDAAYRHLDAYSSGEDLDPESGLNHLGHASACLMMLYGMSFLKPECDDRFKLPSMSDKKGPSGDAK